MLKYVTDLVRDRCRGYQTTRSSVLVAASQAWVIKPLQIIQNFKEI